MTKNCLVTCTTTHQKVSKYTYHSGEYKLVKQKKMPDSMYKLIVYEIEAAEATLVAEWNTVVQLVGFGFIKMVVLNRNNASNKH